jgi:serine phosphatase RsbU (regulator of sigma subunit)
MFRSLKTKLTFAFGSLIVVLFLGMGLFVVDGKESELQEDISSSSQVYAEFTASRVMGFYNTLHEPGNFLAFTREISSLSRQNSDISGIKLYSFSGVMLYDSEVEEFEAYDGNLRTVSTDKELDRLQSNRLSLLLEDGRVIYIKVDENKEITYVDSNEELVLALTNKDRIINIIKPYENAFAVEYVLDYSQLDQRLLSAKQQILFSALIGLILALMLSFMLSVSVTNPIASLKIGAAKIATGDFTHRVKVKTKDEIGSLAKTFNQMAGDLEKSIEATKYQERVEKELELATQIQEDLLPNEKVKLEHLDIAGGLIPASEIGGDAFDYISIGEGKHLIYLGDVTGHGVAAGIVASITSAVLYAFRNLNSLLDLAHALNEVIHAKTSHKVFVTMALGMWNEALNEFSYVNAGHPPILYYNAKERKVTELKLPGIAFGMLADVDGKLTEKKIKMEDDDVIVMYSDGVPEAVNEKGDQYGMSELKRIVQDAANDLYTAEGIKNAVLADVIEYIGQHAHSDDITVVVLKRI